MNSRIWWLGLFPVVLVAALLPQPILAQEERIDLSLQLVPGWYRYEVTAGKDNNFFLEIRNTGDKAVTDIRLSSDKPEDWDIEFEPAEIGYLGVGSLQTVDVNIKPDSKISGGEYRVHLIAEANEIRKVGSIWVEVKAASFWIWVGIGIGVVVVAGFIFVFLRYGRQ